MTQTATREVPTQRSLRIPLVGIHHHRGTSADGKIHAIRTTLSGPSAVCGDPAELDRLGGRFDFDDLSSCLLCIAETSSRTMSLPKQHHPGETEDNS